MDLKHRKLIIEELDPLRKKDFNMLVRNSIPFGSQVFGGADEFSDHDYITKGWKAKLSFDYIVRELGGYYFGDYRGQGFDSCYVKAPNGDVVNFLCMHDEPTYRKWVKATRSMISIIEDVPFLKRKIQNKHLRVKLFEVLKELSEPVRQPVRDPIGGDDVPF
jgi:hypothetical protein